MKGEINRFAFLMNLLGISGKELADAIGVDTSLVSRWRKGERKLTLKGGYVDAIAGYFLTHAYPPKDRQVYTLLRGYDKGFNTSSGAGAVRAVLCRFLCDYETPLLDKKRDQAIFLTNPYRAEFNVYQGQEGKCKSVFDLFTYAQTLEKKHNIIICDWENTDWRANDPEYTAKLERCILDTVCRGHEVKILQDFSTSHRRVVNNIKFWFPLFMTGGVEIYDAPVQREGDVRRATYLIEDEMALNSVSIEGERDNNYITVSDDPRSVSLAERLLAKHIEGQRPVVDSIPANRLDLMADALEERSEKPRESFLATSIPLMTDLPVGILKEVLVTNGVSNEKAAPVLAACDKLRGVFERDMHYYNFVHLLDLDLLERAIQQPYYIDYELSTAFGQEVRISRKQLKETLACIKKKVEKRSKYQVVITPMSKVDTDDLPVRFYIRNGDCALTWNMIKMPYAGFSTASQMAEHFMDSMRKLLERIPAEHQTQEWAVQKLTDLIETPLK